MTALWGLPLRSVNFDTVTLLVAVNTAWEELGRETEIWTVPGVCPRTTFVETWPLESETETVLLSVADPCVTAHVTLTLGIGLPQLSVTCATKGCDRVCPACPLWLFPP